MIEIMTARNDNESKQLSFPIQLGTTEEEIAEQYKTSTDDQIAARLRLRITNNLNQIAAGEKKINDELIQWINGVNVLLIRGGYHPVPVDFRKFGVTKISKPYLVNLTNT